MCIPILPSAAGSLPASSPCRKAIERRFEKTDYCARECQGPSSPLVPASVVVGPFSRAVPRNGAAGAARCSSARQTSGRRADESPPSKRRPTFAGARPGGPLGTLRLARASSAHDAPLPVGGSEGARPPASLRRGTAKRGPKEYPGSPALAASDKPLADVSETRRRLPPIRWRRTPANAPANRFSGPREARSAVGRRLAMPGRPCAPQPERRLTPPAPRSMDTGISSAVGWINLTTLLLRRFASFESCCPSRFGDPKGDILRYPSATGFNPAIGNEGRRSRSAPISGGFRGGTVPRGWVGGFITNAVGDGAAVSPREVPTRVLDWCLGVSMLGTLKSPVQDSQPLGNALVCQEVSGRFRRYPGHRRSSPAGRKNVPATSRQAARAPQPVVS